jgi:molecular chaperone DnaJ
VPTLEGDAKLKIPEGTQSGTVFRMRGKGVPNVSGYNRGDQHVVIRVVTPTKLNDKQKTMLKEFSRMGGEHTQNINTGGDKSFFEKMKDAFMG